MVGVVGRIGTKTKARFTRHRPHRGIAAGDVRKGLGMVFRV